MLMSNSTCIHGEFLFKMYCKFMYFLKISYTQPHGWNCPKTKKEGAKKKLCFAHKILDFHFFYNFCFCSWFYIMPSSMWPFWFEYEAIDYFLRYFTSSMVLEFWVKNLVNKKNSNPPKLTNLQMEFEPHLLNLI